MNCTGRFFQRALPPLFALSILLLSAALLGAAASPVQIEYVLGTFCSVNLYEDGNNKLYARIFSRLREIDRTMSAKPADFRESVVKTPSTGPGSKADKIDSAVDSSLAMINRNAGIAPVKAGSDLLEVLEQAVQYARLSGGAYDPTVGPLVNLWGIGTETERIPGEAEIQAALALVNWQDLVINKEEKTAFLRRKGMALDLGAIAKGYAADEAARLAKKGKARRGIVDLGGNIFALGGRGSGKKAAPWRIGVQDPQGKRGEYIGVLLAADKSIVTSGVYERYFESGGRRYHHILSTKDGWPVNNGLLSVTIMADRSIDADALSTAVFALGYAEGRALIDSTAGVEAVFVFEDRAVKITDGLREIFSLTGKNYFIDMDTP
ncbi:MAG: FAD:protein FMN transferase [Treponema sp.]|jgi:thiamine biosynthesis lipoprotein|nr:FAD:protein FMN transferase [Treponema sp.]